LTESAFVSRRHELEQLEQGIAQTQGGKAGLIIVEGDSGCGKTRLLAEMARRAVGRGLRVFRGEGSDAGGQRPFQMLRRVVNGFVAEARIEPSLASSVYERLGAHGDAVIAALPQLTHELGWTPSHPSAPEAFGATRNVFALVEFLATLGSAQRPALVILDDCQWADEQTLSLIERWRWRQEAPETDENHVLLVLAFRSEEVPAAHLLRRLHPSLHLRLSPLDQGELRQLAESMAGPLPEKAVDVICQLSGGSPLMASAVLRSLVESGALVADARGWRLESSAIPDIPASRMDAELLSRRLDLLPRWTLKLLSAGAILGKEFDLGLAAELGPQSSAEAVQALDEGRRRHLVWVRADGFRCVFVHDKIRAAFLKRLPQDRRQAMHLRAARLLEESAPHCISELAYHFDAAGHSQHALPYALEAAEAARAQHALEIAEQQYRIAERGARNADLAIRYRIAEGLGDILMLRGRYLAAAPLFETAAGLARGDYEQARIQGKQGELAFKRGDTESAVRHFEDALRRLGKTVPRHGAVFLILVLWEAAVQVLHTLLPNLFVHRRRGPGVAIVQPTGPRLLVLAQQGRVHVGSPTRPERGRMLSAHAGAGPGLFRTRPGHVDHRLPSPRHRLREEVAGNSPGPGGPVGAGAVVALPRRGPLCGVPLCRVRGAMSRGGPPARTHGRLLGSTHCPLPDRGFVVLPRRLPRRVGRSGTQLPLGPGIG
jgi:tetratricopeptide (TPR) repeat protein